MRKFLALLAVLALCPVLFAQQSLNNDGVIKLIKAGLSDDLIITTIKASPGTYDISANGIIGLKNGGASEKVIAAVLTKSKEPQTPTTQVPPPPSTEAPAGPPTGAPAMLGAAKPEPRAFLQSESKGGNQNSLRDQSMEMSKDFEKDCPDVKITINPQAADYTVLLNHIEYGLLVRDNQFQIANRNGDLISRTKEGGSIDGGVKKACKIILADWATK